MTQLILASQSPRRKMLLEQASIPFRIIKPADTAECGICTKETPPEMVARLAKQKAADVAPQVTEGIVLGCDTVAECLGKILGKPENRDHAREMLQLLRGREHRVHSGICLWKRPGDETLIRVEATKLFMHPLTDEQIEDYLDSNAWEGKAGAFGLQDRLGWIDVIQGSESNVVGLPMELLADMLAAFEFGEVDISAVTNILNQQPTSPTDHDNEATS